MIYLRFRLRSLSADLLHVRINNDIARVQLALLVRLSRVRAIQYLEIGGERASDICYPLDPSLTRRERERTSPIYPYRYYTFPIQQNNLAGRRKRRTNGRWSYIHVHTYGGMYPLNILASTRPAVPSRDHFSRPLLSALFPGVSRGSGARGLVQGHLCEILPARQ